MAARGVASCRRVQTLGFCRRHRRKRMTTSRNRTAAAPRPARVLGRPRRGRSRHRLPGTRAGVGRGGRIGRDSGCAGRMGHPCSLRRESGLSVTQASPTSAASSSFHRREAQGRLRTVVPTFHQRIRGLLSYADRVCRRLVQGALAPKPGAAAGPGRGLITDLARSKKSCSPRMPSFVSSSSSPHDMSESHSSELGTASPWWYSLRCLPTGGAPWSS